MNYRSDYMCNRSWHLLYKLLSSYIIFLLSTLQNSNMQIFQIFKQYVTPLISFDNKYSVWKRKPQSANITFTHIATSYGRRLITSHISSPIAGFAGNSWRDGSKQFPKASWILKWASFRYVFGSFQSFSWGIPVDSFEA